MLQALDVKTGLPVLGEHAKREGRYLCPECGKLVCPRLGPRKLPHFAHYSTTLCTMARPESQRHQALKWRCRDFFAPLDVDWEVALGTRRADAVVGGLFVVECQVSPLSIEEWLARTANYNRLGYPVLWLWDVKRLCRKNTLAEAMELDRRGRGIWTPAEIRHCHGESRDIIYVADKHSISACRLEPLTPREQTLARTARGGWPAAIALPAAMRKLKFLPVFDTTARYHFRSQTTDLRLVRLGKIDG